jgi:membrane associated rhomboid family serine protease
MFPVSDVIPSRTTPFVTIGLIVLNTLAFLYELQMSDRHLRVFITQYGVVPAFVSLPTVVTSMFLHGGWLHFVGNMLYLWIFGDNVEDRLGHVRYLLFYLFAGAMAVSGQVLMNPSSLVPMIGASGAIAGVMGAYFVFYPQSRVLTAVFIFFFLDLVEIPAIFFLGIWFLMQLFSGVGSIGADAASGGVAFWAHVAGFVTGATVGAFGRRARSSRSEQYWYRG